MKFGYYVTICLHECDGRFEIAVTNTLTPYLKLLDEKMPIFLKGALPSSDSWKLVYYEYGHTNKSAERRRSAIARMSAQRRHTLITRLNPTWMDLGVV